MDLLENMHDYLKHKDKHTDNLRYLFSEIIYNEVVECLLDIGYKHDAPEEYNFIRDFVKDNKDEFKDFLKEHPFILGEQNVD